MKIKEDIKNIGLQEVFAIVLFLFMISEYKSWS